MTDDKKIIAAYTLAQERYAELGIDTEKALQALAKFAISLHCWQGDDVGGFEATNKKLTGGIMSTGNYHGRARNADELRMDLEMALSLIPGKHRVNLHACYAETKGIAVDRAELKPEHYSNWIDWAKQKGLGLDFNPTLFSHPKSKDGLTLAHPDKSIRDYWIAHCVACRKIAEAMGKSLNSPVVNNIWIADGFKDYPIDRMRPRQRLEESLDTILKEKIDKKYQLDAVESKLFGIGSEACVIGSHEFYMGYALKNKTLLTLDSGHFHPTEQVSNKISSMLMFSEGLLLHVSRPMRWDSDHVVILEDELRMLMQEVLRSGQADRVHIGLDYFDATINRIAAWVIGTNATLKALLLALLENTDELRTLEENFDFTSRLAYVEELKMLPACAVWDYYCLKNNIPVGHAWLKEVKDYEAREFSKRI